MGQPRKKIKPGMNASKKSNHSSVERAHRIKKKGNSENPGKPRTIVCRFLNHKDETNILKYTKKLKGKKIFINEDFSQENMELRKELWKKVKRQRSKEIIKV